MIIDCDKTWLRPDKAYFDSILQSQGVDPNEFEWNGRYKIIRELRGLSIFGLCLYELYKTPFFVQMNRRDSSPDAFVMRVSPDNPTTSEIGQVEITFYGRSKVGLPEESLAHRLNAKGGKIWKLPLNYCLLIHIGRDLQVNHEEVYDCLNKAKTDFQAFSIQEISNYPDTIARVCIYRPKYISKDINLGEVCHKLKESNILHIVTAIRGKQPKENEISI
jgi:hypothetical protein